MNTSSNVAGTFLILYGCMRVNSTKDNDVTKHGSSGSNNLHNTSAFLHIKGYLVQRIRLVG
jgi:hypothetical protein